MEGYFSNKWNTNTVKLDWKSPCVKSYYLGGEQKQKLQ